MAQVNIAGQQAQISTLLADNSNEGITPLDQRTLALNVTDSVPFLNDLATISGVWTHTDVVKGITPVSAEDLATKDYVDTFVGAAAGDVIGPASSFDTELIVFSGTTGKLITGGTGVTLSQTGDFGGLGNLSFSTATSLIGTVAVGNIGDIANTTIVAGAWSFDDITVVTPTIDGHAATKKYVDDNIGAGDVGVSGTPVDNQIAVWTGGAVIEGDANLTWNGATNTLSVGGTLSINELTVDNVVINGNDISTSSGDLTISSFGDVDFQANDIVDVANLTVTTAITASTFNAIPLTSVGVATDFLTAAGTYVAIGSLGGGDVNKVGTPVNNQIGVWTGDGTIEGDSGLLYDGTGTFTIAASAGNNELLVGDGSTDASNSVVGNANTPNDGDSLLGLRAEWNSSLVSDITMQSGDDTVNKDDGKILFRTRESGSSIATSLTLETDGTATFSKNIQMDGKRSIGLPVEATISSGAVTITGNYHRMIGESSLADDLTDINGGISGQIIVIRNANGVGVVTVKETGNIRLDGSDFSLASGGSFLQLINSGGSVWYELSRSTPS
jgi:hypothetical protein